MYQAYFEPLAGAGFGVRDGSFFWIQSTGYVNVLSNRLGRYLTS
jgi:hypothetical protein